MKPGENEGRVPGLQPGRSGADRTVRGGFFRPRQKSRFHNLDDCPARYAGDMSEERYHRITEHFERAASGFDTYFYRVMPRYEELLAALVESLPFDASDPISVVDLGCGTGNLTRAVTGAFPEASVLCIDVAENMLAMARGKLGGNDRITFMQGDVRTTPLPGPYNAVVSSMVLHHVDITEKPALYRRLYNALRPGGVFFVIDLLRSDNSHLQHLYLEKWKEFMRQSELPEETIAEQVILHRQEDRPATMEEELAVLGEAGFSPVDIVLKQYYVTLFGGVKKG